MQCAFSHSVRLIPAKVSPVPNDIPGPIDTLLPPFVVVIGWVGDHEPSGLCWKSKHLSCAGAGVVVWPVGADARPIVICAPACDAKRTETIPSAKVYGFIVTAKLSKKSRRRTIICQVQCWI